MRKKVTFGSHKKVRQCRHCKKPYRWNGALQAPSCTCEERRELESRHGQANWLRDEEAKTELAADLAYIDEVAEELEAKNEAYKNDPDAYFGVF